MLDRSLSPYNTGRRSPSPINRDAYVRSLFNQSSPRNELGGKKVILRSGMPADASLSSV